MGYIDYESALTLYIYRTYITPLKIIRNKAKWEHVDRMAGRCGGPTPIFEHEGYWDVRLSESGTPQFVMQRNPPSITSKPVELLFHLESIDLFPREVSQLIAEMLEDRSSILEFPLVFDRKKVFLGMQVSAQAKVAKRSFVLKPRRETNRQSLHQ